MKRALLSLLFTAWCWTGALAGVNCSLPFVLQNNTLADANQVMANFNAIIACLFNAAAAGQNNDIIALNALTVPITPLQGGTPVYLGGSSGGTINDQTVPITTPGGFTETGQYVVMFYAGASNTGEMSLNVASTGQTAFYRQSPSGPQKMTGGEVIAGQIIVAAFNSLNPLPPTTHPTWNPGWFECLNCGSIQYGGFGPQTPFPAAATVDLGTVPTHNAVITGGATITSFGATASTTFPVYFVAFTGSSTIIANTTNCTTVGGCIFLPTGVPEGNIITKPGDTAWLLYLGTGSITLPSAAGNWQLMFYQRQTGAPVINNTANCGFNGSVFANGASNTVVTGSWGSAVLVDQNVNVSVYAPSTGWALDITTGTGASTPGGMDGHPPAANSFIYMYGISDGSVFNVLGSPFNSFTGVGLPTDYHFVCYIGAVRTDNTTKLYGIIGKGQEVHFVIGGPGLPQTAAVPPYPLLIAAGMVGSACSAAIPGWAAEPVRGSTGWMPERAVAGDFIVTNRYLGGATSDTMVAPNANYGSILSSAGIFPPIASLGSGPVSGKVRIPFEDVNIYFCSDASGGAIFAYGWKDEANAN